MSNAWFILFLFHGSLVANLSLMDYNVNECTVAAKKKKFTWPTGDLQIRIKTKTFAQHLASLQFQLEVFHCKIMNIYPNKTKNSLAKQIFP